MTTTTVSYLEIPLWPGGAPEENGLSGAENTSEAGYVGNVTKAVMYVYRAERPNGQAVVLCPGGGFARVAVGYEGHAFAEWFNERGITCAVLKYRLPNGHREIPSDDARQAMRIMRSRAKEWGVRRTGIMGASVGGYVAASAAVLPAPDARPDFQVLLYPVISMEDSLTHLVSRDRLMGGPLTRRQAEAASLDRYVTPATAPAFIAVAADDEAVSPENSIVYSRALLRSGVRSSLHIYPEGGHGFVFSDSFRYREQWLGELDRWLRELPQL